MTKIYINKDEILYLNLGSNKNNSTTAGLDKYLNPEKNIAKVDFYNGTDNMDFDKRWEIRYKLYPGKNPSILPIKVCKRSAEPRL